MKNRLPLDDCWEITNTPWAIDESDKTGIVDGVNILARAIGPFFIVDEASRNGRYYSKQLWERAIENSQQPMETGQMLGTIGHDQPLDDNALREGKASHRVSRLWIDEKTGLGMGEILVLGTTAGKELNAYLRGGVTFPVSSRAFGEYKGKRGKDDIIDPESYVLECFDFVRTPGVSIAHARVVENHNDDSTDSTKSPNPNIEVSPMTEHAKALEHIAEAKAQLQVELNSALDKVQSLTAQSESAATSQKLVLAKNEELVAQVEALTAAAAVAAPLLKTYESIGVASELSTLLATHEATAKSWEKLGTHEELTGVVATLEGLVASCGSAELLTAHCDHFEAYTDLGTPETLSKALDVLEQYSELGKPEAIEKAFEAAELLASSLTTQRTDEQQEELVKKFGIGESQAARLLGKFGYDETLETLESMRADDSEGDDASRYKLREDLDENLSDDDKNKKKKQCDESRVSRMFSTQQ